MQIVSIDTSRRNCARELRAPLWWFFQATCAIASRILSASTPYFAAYAGATIENIAAAVSVRPVPSFGGGTALSPWKPPSLVFSTPIAIAVSYAPDATAYAAWRSDSAPVAQKFSTRVTGLSTSCSGRASVMPLMPPCAVPSQ